MAYPDILLQKLASGVGVVGLNPLLVGQDGTSYTNTSLSFTPILSNKFTTAYTTNVYTDTAGSTYSTFTTGFNSVSNTNNGVSVSNTNILRVSLLSYTSKNKPYIQATPKPVIEVEPKVKASNSHSIYKGALVGNQVAGKIQVGNGSNGYESKVLENSEVPRVVDIANYNNITVNTGECILYIGGAIGGEKGAYYQRLGSSLSNYTVANLDFTVTTAWLKVNQIPQHPTISLDNSNSPASKWFETLEEGDNGVLAGVYGEELVYNGATTSFDGDDDTFEQLTNGTITDLNGNTCRTFKGSLPINGKVK